MANITLFTRLSFGVPSVDGVNVGSARTMRFRVDFNARDSEPNSTKGIAIDDVPFPEDCE